MAEVALDETIDRCHRALLTLVNGDASPWAELFSNRDDVTLGNPFGPFVRGLDDVMATASAAADRYRDGEIVAVERVATYTGDDLACIAEVERFRARVGGSDQMSDVALRVTTTFCREDGAWKVVHRHADPITTPRSTESVISS